MIYAVIDTNVLVSALLSKKSDTATGEILIDMDDLIFYEVAMEKRQDDAYLVTGNQKHYPVKDFIVTPSEMIAILSS